MQTGGPSGGCIPAEHLDTPVDYESLAQLGSIMGSGGMIVMDETRAWWSRPVLHGILHERIVRQVHPLPRRDRCRCTACWTKITDGRSRPRPTWRLLEELCDMVRHTSLCGLGQTAPNPVLSTLRYFRDEYEAHMTGDGCAAGACRRVAPR